MTDDVMKLPVDSEEGIEHLVIWARRHKLVLQPYHRDIAKQHGVSYEGVIFADPIPARPDD